MDFTTYGSTILVDTCQLVMKYLKDVGIDVKLNTKEYGAYISTTFYGKFDSMAFGPQTGFLEPDNFLYGQYYPGELKNQSHFNDPVVADLLIRQRRTPDLAKRKELIFEIQRYLAKQQYYVQLPSPVHVSVWDGALKNYAPNFGYDYGGRLLVRLARPVGRDADKGPSASLAGAVRRSTYGKYALRRTAPAASHLDPSPRPARVRHSRERGAYSAGAARGSRATSCRRGRGGRGASGRPERRGPRTSRRGRGSRP